MNCIKQAGEFGLVASGVKMAGLLPQINDVDALGLQTAQGLSLAETFYWDLNDRTRAFATRVAPATSGIMPNALQAACYSAALHYMKAAAAMGASNARKSGGASVARLKAMPVDDDVTGSCKIRQDSRVMNDAYLFEVKSPKNLWRQQIGSSAAKKPKLFDIEIDMGWYGRLNSVARATWSKWNTRFSLCLYSYLQGI